MFALRLGQSHGESICISTKIKIWRMQFLSAMPLFVTQFIIQCHIVIVNIICILKTHILASLFLKFLDTFHAERSTSQNKKFQTLADSADHQFLPIRKDKAVFYWSSTHGLP